MYKDWRQCHVISEQGRPFFMKYFSPSSVLAIAFFLAVIECCIDQWTDHGTRKETNWGGKQFKTAYQSYIGSINDIWQHGIVQSANLFETHTR